MFLAYGIKKESNRSHAKVQVIQPYKMSITISDYYYVNCIALHIQGVPVTIVRNPYKSHHQILAGHNIYKGPSKLKKEASH